MEPSNIWKKHRTATTRLAILDQERAGLDIITDGEIRRESYSNRFATELDGVDLDNPGMAPDRSGHPNPVPRIVGKIKRRGPVEVRDLKFLKSQTTKPVKMTVPGPFTMAQQAQNDFYKSEEEMALDYAGAVNAEIKDLFAAGADVVQIDEPYMQARADKARHLRRRGARPRARGRDGQDSGSYLLRLRRDHPRTAGGLFVPARGCWHHGEAGLHRNGAVQPRHVDPQDAPGQDDYPRRARPFHA